MTNVEEWDVFVSHAGPDKDAFVIPLAEALRAEGIKVWLDRWTIELGDSISESISEGLKRSRFGIVVLSEAFFSRAWPKKELGAFFASEGSGAQRIIPIWHRISYSEVWEHAPLLADRMAAKSEEGVPSIVQRVCRLVRRDSDPSANIAVELVEALTLRLFPNLPISTFWETQMLADLDTQIYRSIADVELAYLRAKLAVEAFSKEQPSLFLNGTDYITKALGFVDLCFRARHNWAPETERAFHKHSDKIQWDARLA